MYKPFNLCTVQQNLHHLLVAWAWRYFSPLRLRASEQSRLPNCRYIFLNFLSTHVWGISSHFQAKTQAIFQAKIKARAFSIEAGPCTFPSTTGWGSSIVGIDGGIRVVFPDLLLLGHSVCIVVNDEAVFVNDAKGKGRQE